MLKTVKQATPDAYEMLLDSINQTKEELNCTYTNLASVVEPDLIDYYIYQVKAMQTRYQFLLREAKEMRASLSTPAE